MEFFFLLSSYHGPLIGERVGVVNGVRRKQRQRDWRIYPMGLDGVTISWCVFCVCIHACARVYVPFYVRGYA